MLNTTYLLKRNEVLTLCRISKNTMNRLIEKGEFPEPVALSERTRAWRTREIEAWIDGLPRASERDSAQP